MTAPLDPALAVSLAHEARRHRPLPPLDDCQEEVAFWRREMAAKLETLCALHVSSETAGEEDRSADIRVNFMMPIMNAFRDADAREWHARCEICGEFMRPDQRLGQIETDESGGRESVHAECVGDKEGYCEDLDEARIRDRAKAILAGDKGNRNA